VGRQIDYAINSDLGFKKDAIVNIGLPWNGTLKDDRKKAFLQKIKEIPGIETASLGALPPTSGGAMSTTIDEKIGKKQIHLNLQNRIGDTNFIKVYQLKLLAGRNVEPSDTMKECIINETCLH